MDWNLKTPNWDFTEYEHGGGIQNIDGSSSFTGLGSNKEDFSVDLKLGQVVFDTGNESEDSSLKVTNVSKLALSPSSGIGSSKRARAIAGNNGVQMAYCLVDGCNADLSNCREYHRRHKVCEVHSKTPEVSINGNKQRFCQQCSRFHSPEEFDEGKRSCRKRLDGHNRRRRKPQPETLSRSGSLFSPSQGTTMLQFSSPLAYPTTAVTNPIWAGFVKTEEDVKFYNRQAEAQSLVPHKQSSFLESSSTSSSNKGSVNRFNLFHSSNLELNNHHLSRKASSSSTCQPLLNNLASSQTNSSTTEKMFCDGFPSRDCALSLLSSSPIQTSCMGPSHVMRPNSIPTGHMLDSGLTYTNLDPMEPIMDAAADHVHCQGMFHMAPPHASRDNETPQTLPFYWE